MTLLPFKPGDWVADQGDNVAKVKDVYESEGEVLLDLVMYDREGEKLGRLSPACGGPRNYEPACSSNLWERIEEPVFPLSLKWITGDDGKRTARYWTGKRLPPAQWERKIRKMKVSLQTQENPDFRRALEAIASGHNDPRRLAQEILGLITKD
jgi:hypothetical protein